MEHNNKCYDPDCKNEECFNPEHFNFICMDPNCEMVHCEKNAHYNKDLLKNFQEKTNFKEYEHNNVDTKVDKICDCADDCCTGNTHHEHNHEHNHEDCCDDDCCSDIKICNCGDCDDDEEEEEVIKEGIPLLKNRSIQIIVSSGILFALGHLLEYFSVFGGTLATVIFAIGAIIAGYDIAKMAKKAVFTRHTITPAVLMCIAAVASFLIGHPEEGAAVTFLYFIAEFLEDYSEQRAQHSIKSLVEIAPEKARLKVGNTVETVSIDEVKVGEIVIVKPGDKVPLDGKVIEGVSTINQSSITGESIPVTKTIKDKVFAGTVNQDGYLEIEVTKASKDSVISKIVTLVKQSQLNRSHTETYVEKIAKYYTPAIIIITICVAIIPPLFFGENIVDWIYRALSLMVISCPCAFLISTPIGMVSSITSATRQGVLIKGSSYVEEMRNIKAVIFDKTGTLTEGKLEIMDIDVLDDKYTKDDLIEIASSLEKKSTHPIATAIVNHAKDNNLQIKEVKNFKNIPGKGIVGYINNKQYYAANESLIENSEFIVSRETVINYASDGKTVVFIGNEEKVIGIITVMDKIRDESEEVIRNLNNAGVKTVMLTGDNKIAAHAVSDKIGVTYIYSDLLPEDKLNMVDTIRNKFGDVAMVGDGINDAPALARSNVGIAMGAAGSDVAIETADVALMQDDLTKLPYLFSLSTKTMSIIKQNIITAISVKFLFVILAILGLITLMMAVGIGDMGLTLLVILNSFRIGRVKDPIF